ncbi:hypothetical protein POTOM_003386 [Populus tomentosa]|uniref:CCHC-type domain-containing protein n=1 Tax=Populus tomentosa TaxID=118781 RepID=A0A8X8DLM8_POPTO|nr:hypothetical protein POTOM_003386 [Populus tomentosa]
MIGNNQRHEDERGRKNFRERIDPACKHHPIPPRQLAYEEELSDDEEYAERLEIEGFLDWLVVVEKRSFDYMEIPEDKKYQDCRQGSRVVQAYVKEFHKLSSRNNLLEIDAQQVARTKAIGVARNLVDSMHVATYKGKFPLNPPPSMTNFTKGPSGSRTQMTIAKVVPLEAPRNPYARPTSDKCYWCGQPGHRFNQCPKQGIVNLIGPRGDIPEGRKGRGRDYVHLRRG